MKHRHEKKMARRTLAIRSRAEKRLLDSHTRLDPITVFSRVMRVKISKPLFDQIQATHFTYWYMD